VHLINPKVLATKLREANEQKVKEISTIYTQQQNHLLNWNFYSLEKESEEYNNGMRISVDFPANVKYVTFHAKGDYFGTVCPDTSTNSDQVFIHSLSKGASQRPFSKSKGKIFKVQFHSKKTNFIRYDAKKCIRI